MAQACQVTNENGKVVWFRRIHSDLIWFRHPPLSSPHRVRKLGGSWSCIPAPFSRDSRVPNFCHGYPEYRFLSQFPIPCPNFGESRFPGRSQIPYAINGTRIPHVCVCVFFFSNPRSREIPFQTQFSCLLFAVVSIAMCLEMFSRLQNFFIICCIRERARWSEYCILISYP